MKVITSEIEMPEDNPFQNDVLNRVIYAEARTHLIQNSEEEWVICLKAQ